MAVLEKRTISKRTVDALEGREGHRVLGQRAQAGFGVRVYPNGGKTYVVQTRAGGKPAKRIAIGRHGVVTAEEARRRAALIVSRIKAGEDPAPEPLPVRQANGPTVEDLATAVPGRPCRGALQAGHGGGLPVRDRKAHPAGLRQAVRPGRRADAGGGVPRGAPGPAGHGQPGGRPAGAHLPGGRGPGRGAGGHQPVPADREIPRAPARALPDRAGVPPPGAGPWTRWKPTSTLPSMPQRRCACSC